MIRKRGLLIEAPIWHQFTETGTQEIVLTIDGKADISELRGIIERGKQLSVEIKQYRQRRSLDANSYMWILCQKIAESIGQTPENVYREFIRRVGQFEFLPIKNEAVDRFIEAWSSKGIGWFAEKAWDSKIEGYTTVKAYYGSSVYDTKEMSILIDEIVTQCKEMGIETMTPAEIAALKEAWGKVNDWQIKSKSFC